MNFVVLEPPVKVPRNLSVLHLPMIDFSIPRKFSPRNDHSYRSAKVFFLENFPQYSMLDNVIKIVISRVLR